jgi:hypothetical protein
MRSDRVSGEEGEVGLKADVNIVFSDGTMVGLSVFERFVQRISSSFFLFFLF